MEQTQNNSFNLLRNAGIYAILDGDSKFEEYKFSDNGANITIAMPYLNGADLRNLSSSFGLIQKNTGISRWQYLDNLFEYCIKEDLCSDLLLNFFDKKKFKCKFWGHSVDVIDEAYNTFVQTILKKINGFLYFDDYELILKDNQFSVRQIGCNVEIQAPSLKNINYDYITGIYKRATEDIENKNFDSAITKSRSLLEEIFCFVIEKKNAIPPKTGNIYELYKKVKDLYNMHNKSNIDKCINALLSGLVNIVKSISEMRNSVSDAHGLGSKRFKVDEHHTRLCVNSAITMSEFILAVEQKANSKQNKIEVEI